MRSTCWEKENLNRLVQTAGHDLLPWKTAQLDYFIQHGFPTVHQEDWKYTDVTALTRQSFRMNEKLTVDVDKLQNHFFTFDAYRLVFVNGYFSDTLSSFGSDQNCIRITLFNQARSDFLLSRLKKSAVTPNSSFSALNNALFQDGVLIDVAEKAALSKPIHIVHLQSQHPSSQMSHVKYFIALSPHSQATVIEDYIGFDQAVYFNNVSTDVDVQSNAILHHYRLQRESHRAFHIAHTNIYLAQNSVVNTYHVATGSALMRHHLHYHFQEKNAAGHLFGLYHGKEKQHLDMHTRIDHFASHGKSHQNYKGVMSEQSRAVFNGKIIVHPNAKKTNAHLDNRNLLLSPTAEIDTKPELEIYTDDVQCSHGATVGCLEEDALFYLQSRGIAIEKARQMLIQSFVNEVLEAIPDENMQSYIRSAVTQHGY